MINKYKLKKFVNKFAGKNIFFYIGDNIFSKNFLATTYCLGKDKNNKKIIIIILDKKILKYKFISNAMLKAVLLHEIGHIKMKHFDFFSPIKNNADAEYEAHLWAIQHACKFKYNNIVKYLIEMFLGWKQFKKNKKRLRYYYNAYLKLHKILFKNSLHRKKFYTRKK